MGSRKVVVKETVAENIAAAAWYIESKGMVHTADKFADNIYDFFVKLSDSRRTHALCRDAERAAGVYVYFSYRKNML